MFRLIKCTLLFAILVCFTSCQEGAEKPRTAETAKTAESKPQISRAEVAMLEAAAAGNNVQVQGWLDRGVDVNMRGKDQNTPIMEAAFAGHLATVKLLLDHGADIGAKKSDGETVSSLGGGHKEIVELFKNVSTMVDAASKGDNKIVAELIDKGTPVNGLDTAGRSALTEASWNGRTDTVKLLLEKGANPNIKKSDGQTPLNLASAQKHQEIVNLLNAASSKQAQTKQTPIAPGK